MVGVSNGGGMRRLFNLRIVLVQCCILLLVACSTAANAEEAHVPAYSKAAQSDPVPVTTPTAIPQPKVVTAVSSVPIGKHGGSLTVVGQADIPHRDVHQESQETLTALGPGMAYSRLLRLHTGGDVKQPSLPLECDLCQSWRLTPEFDYEFQLREDVKWQNVEPVNGRGVVAEDLVFSYQRMQTPGWPNASLFADRGIASFQATESHTLRVNLDFLDSDALLSLSDGHSKIVAKEVVEKYGDLKDSPVVGSGPWIWSSTLEGIGTTLNRNPDYFEDGLPFLDELIIKLIEPSEISASAPQERLAAFQAGLVDVLTLPPKEWRQLYSGILEFNSTISHQAGTGIILSLNTQSAQLEVRQAVLKAIDPWEYVDVIWEDQGDSGLGLPVQDNGWYLRDQDLRGDYFANPSEARKLLSSTGALLPMEVELAVADFGSIYQQLALRVADDLRDVGFEPIIRPLNPSHYMEILVEQENNFQITLGVLPPTTSANRFLTSLLHSEGPGNLAQHQDTTLNALIEQQAAELDPKLRKDLLSEIQRHVLDQAYMFSPVIGSSRWVFNWEVQNFHPNTALSEYNYWSRVWLEQ